MYLNPEKLNDFVCSLVSFVYKRIVLVCLFRANNIQMLTKDYKYICES
jgi:hypothetical protein